MTTFSALVLSDIHADEKDPEWTHVLAEPPLSRPKQQPLSDLLGWVERTELKTQYLIVPGDIANQADAVGLAYAWRRLNSLADQLGASLIAAPGNHDVVTHGQADDPRSTLKSLTPSFPTRDADLDDHFWRHGWSMIEDEAHRILVLDSTVGFPPFPVGAQEGSQEMSAYKHEIDRGSFLERIEDDLELVFADSDHRLNVAVIHHHPQEHQLRSYLQDGYGPMRRGGDLIDLFSRHPSMGRWIVIHGHKHIPQLAHAVSSSSNGPLVLCAASLGAKLWSPIDTIARNQFHVLNMTDDHIAGTSSIRGSIASYAWGFGDGWSESDRSGVGLPAVGGFGCVDDFRTLSAQIVDLMDGASLQFIAYRELVERVPQLPYQLPADFKFLEDDLEARGFAFSRDRQQRLLQLSRTTEAP